MTTTTPEGSPEEPTLERLRELTRSIERINESLREGARRDEEFSRRRAEENRRRDEENRRRDEEFRRRDEEFRRRAEENKRRDEELKRFQEETARQMQETDRRLQKAEDLFTTQWGKLMESLVRGDLVKLLQARNIAVERLVRETNHRRNGEHYELDILAVNGGEVVAVEVKTTLRPKDVKRFRSKLGRFKEWWPEYRDRRVLGAMAYLKAPDDVVLHAERQGFFVIRATGSSSSIVNAEDFEPRVFA